MSRDDEDTAGHDGAPPAPARGEAVTDPGAGEGAADAATGLASPGTSVGGYIVEAVAGTGGMGVVYRALDPELARPVALKLIAPALAADPAFRGRFTSEMLAAAALEHPHVLPVYRAGEDGGRLYMAMRFVDGPSLAGLLRDVGRLSVSRTLRLIDQVAGALDAAHAIGLVHRDVKPGNVLIAAPGQAEHAYLADFGLAVSPSGGRGGRWAGSVQSIAPEQIRGEAVGPAADVYALGCLLVTCLAGRPPFVGAQEAVLTAHLTSPPPALETLAPGLPRGLGAVVRRALAKRPGDRFASAGSLAEAARACRHDVLLLGADDDGDLVADLAAALGDAGLDVERGSPEPAGWPPTAAYVLVVGASGLGGGLRDAVVAADRDSRRDGGPRLIACLGPRAPDAAHPSLAFLAGHPLLELGAGPGRREVARLLRALRPLTAPSVPVVADGDREPPYRGLEPFDERHARLFFGREDEVGAIVGRLRATRTVVLTGPSGCGKSSLARAGVAAAWTEALDAGGGRVVYVRPGAAPLAALALAAGAPAGDAARLAADPAALADALGGGGDEPVLLVVDQLEEVFTLCPDRDERRGALAALRFVATVPGGRVHLLATIRSDFLGHLAVCPPFAALALEHGHLLTGMRRDALVRAIEEPARLTGLAPAAGLTERLLDDVGDRAEALPLLQHVLLEVWRQRDGRTLTLEAYLDSGGLEGALAGRAERIYGDLDEQRRELARHVLLRLVEPGVGTEDTRRRADLRELAREPAEAAAVESVVARLAAARLLALGHDPVRGETTVEPTHEALIRGWPRLRGWIDEERAGLRLERQLSVAAREWHEGGRDDGLLLRGSRLLLWQERDRSRLSPDERTFVGASIALSRREATAARRRRRVVVGGLAVALAAVTGVAGVALRQRSEAISQRDAARSRALAAAASAQRAADPQVAMLLALDAYRASPTPQAEVALRQATHDTVLRALVRPQGAFVGALAFAPAGERFATASGGRGGGIEILDVDGGRRRLRIPGTRGIPRMLAFGRGGRTLLLVTSPAAAARSPLPGDGPDAPLTVWDARDGRFLRSLPLAPGALAVALSPDGRLLDLDDATGERVIDWERDRVVNRVVPTQRLVGLAVGDRGELAVCGQDGTLTVHRPGSPATGPIPGCARPEHFAASFRPLRILVSGGTAGALKVWAVDGRAARLRRLPTPPNPTTLAPDDPEAFLPDGRVVSGHVDGTVQIWDPELRVVTRLPGRDGARSLVAMSPDGRLVGAVGDAGPTVAVWEPARPGPGSGQAGVYWSLTDGAPPVLVSAGAGSTIRVAPLGAAHATTLRGAEANVAAAVATPDGRTLATLGYLDWHVRIWDVPRRRVARTLGVLPVRGRGALLLTIAPDGRAVAGSDGRRVRLWRSGSPEVVLPPARGAPMDARALAFDGTGERLAAADGFKGIEVWETATGDRVHLGDGGVAAAVAFSPDGRFVAEGDEDGTVRVWDPAGRRVLARYPVHAAALQALAFSADGRLLASGARDGTERVTEWRTGGRILDLPRNADGVGGLAFLPDGRLVALGGHLRVSVWRCDVCGPIDEVARLAERRSVRQLSDADEQALVDR